LTADKEHILLVRLSSLGDIILASPVASALRTARPAARITWLVDSGYRELVENDPNVDEVLEFDYTGAHRGPAGIRRLAEELAPVELMIDLQHKVRTSLLGAYLRPREKKTLVKRRGFGVLRALIGKDAIMRAPHQVWRYLAVIDAADTDSPPPRPVLYLDRRLRTEALAETQLDEGRGPLIGLFPGARHELKRWPPVHLAALADRCVAEGMRIAVLGGPGDEGLVHSTLECMKTEPLLVSTAGSLQHLGALISACDAVVSPDSGPAHMAAGLGVAVITLFGPTSPERWAPVGQRARVVQQGLPCSPCSNHGSGSCSEGTHECMASLSPERVWQELDEVLRDVG